MNFLQEAETCNFWRNALISVIHTWVPKGCEWLAPGTERSEEQLSVSEKESGWVEGKNYLKRRI